MFLLGLDDLFIDLVYWGRKLIRRWRIYEKIEAADEKYLYETPEKPLAIMVPAWNEVEEGDSLNQALINADRALYEPKHSGKDRHTFHAPS